MTAQEAQVSVRLAELVGTMSYAADLGLGQPMEHCMRQTAIALRLADKIGTTAPEREATYYVGMLLNAYCHSDATEQTQWFGDDISFKSDGIDILGMNTFQMLGMLVRKVSSHGSALDRAKRLATLPVAGQRQLISIVTTHSALGEKFARSAGFDDLVAMSLGQAYEQWDGKGQPRQLHGDQIALPARLAQFAGPTESYARRHGLEAAVAMVRKNSGAQFDPQIADVFCRHAEQMWAGLDEIGTWDAFMATEPGLVRRVMGADLDRALEALADLVDIKSPFLAGHSRGVANLASEAARLAGMSSDDVVVLRRAGLIHDLGRMGVGNSVWDKPGRLNESEIERVRLHPYLTDRMLAKIPALSRVREVAARHHERLDGSGYPRGLTSASLTPLDRLLAAADVYHALTEPRPYRPAYQAEQAATELSVQVRRGLLDGEAVAAVLRAAGHRAPARREWPGGLTSREVDVLRLLARGQANKQIAQRLGVSPKTVSNHVEHIYSKIDVSSRAAATLFATQHGLLGAYEAE